MGGGVEGDRTIWIKRRCRLGPIIARVNLQLIHGEGVIYRAAGLVRVQNKFVVRNAVNGEDRQ